MHKTSLITVSVLALLACSAFAAAATAQDSVNGATPDPSIVTPPTVSPAPEPTKDASDGNVSSSNATLPPDDQQYHILDDNSSAPLIAPGPQGEGDELMYTTGLADQSGTNILPIIGVIVAAVAIAGGAIGLAYQRKQARKIVQ